MARAIRIPFTADPREFIRGLGLMEDDVKQFERRLRDSEDAGDQLEDNLEQNFRNIARDADRAGEKAGRSFDQQMTTNVRKGSFRGAAGALLAETGQELVESWGEAIREGNPAGVVREVFSNAALIGAAAAGPIGAGVGMAISLVTSFIDTSEARREAIRSSVNSLFDGISGDTEIIGQEAAAAYWRGFVTEADIPGRVQEALGLDNARDAAAEVSRISRETGLSVADVSLAIIGNRDALGVVGERIAANNRLYDETLDKAGQVKDVDFDRFLQLQDQADALNDQKAELSNLLDLGGSIKSLNEESARLQWEQAEALNEIKADAQGIEVTFKRTRTPEVADFVDDMGVARTRVLDMFAGLKNMPDPTMQGLKSGLNDAEGAARRVKSVLDSMPRSIDVDVNYRRRGAPQP